jgi:predicted Zn-dependent protease
MFRAPTPTRAAGDARPRGRFSFPGSAAFLAATLAVGTAVGCAVNPVTGQRELALISEAQEIQIGRDADQDISRSMGLYEDEALQRYVQELGARMARDSERPNLPWTFRVIDDPVVNAFALPGGFVYVTRGILAHFSSEAELAGVLGHEIGHVTARHGVQRVSRAQLAQLGLGIGTILAPEMAGVADAAGAGLSLLFLRYGRDAERQADDLGLNYMTSEGYDPREMAATFEMLARASGAEDGERLPGFLSTHPDPLERRDRILARIEAGAVSGTRVERESYLNRLAGMPFGENPREGFFRDSRFHHPDLAFRMDFPQGWRTLNQKEGVQAVSAEQDAVLVLTLATESSAAQARDAFTRQQGITASGARNEPVNGLPASRVDFQAATQDGSTLQGTAAFIEHGDRVYRLLGYATQARWSARGGVVRDAIGSFRRETDSAILAAQPARIELVRIPEAMTLETFHQRYPSTISIEEIGNINRVRPGQPISPGTLMKRVSGGQQP